MKGFQASAYGPVFATLLDVDRRRPLDAGTPDRALRERLSGVSITEAFAHTRIADREMAGCCLSGVWLVHDFLDEAHRICQEIDSPAGSYWHAFMHRREGDFGNSKYWFRRVGTHEVFAPLAERAAELAKIRGNRRLIEQLVANGRWDPFAFVDAVERTDRRGPADDRELCLDIQQAEWELLFDWCYCAAVAATSRNV
jgi:hypothetical protein